MSVKNNHSVLSALLLIIGMVLVIPMMISCGKESAASPLGLNTQLNIVNVSPDVTPVDLYIASRKQNVNSYIYSLPSGYLYLSSLATPLQIRTFTANTTIFTKHDTALSVNTKYSLFITGLVSEKTLRTFLVVDSDAVPASGRGKVRFINASARAINLDLYANATVAFQNQGFAAVTKYVELSAGIYDFKIYNSGTSTIATDLPNITIQDGRLYTLYTRGIVGRTDSAAFVASVITNR